MDMNRIYQIESSGNPAAYNQASGARGLGQITPIALQDYNQQNPRNPFTMNDMWDPDANHQVSAWTYNSRIPALLGHYGIPDSPENRIWAYHDGIGNVKNGYKSRFVDPYIQKYNQSGDGQ